MWFRMKMTLNTQIPRRAGVCACALWENHQLKSGSLEGLSSVNMSRWWPPALHVCCVATASIATANETVLILKRFKLCSGWIPGLQCPFPDGSQSNDHILRSLTVFLQSFFLPLCLVLLMFLTQFQGSLKVVARHTLNALLCGCSWTWQITLS